MKRGDLMTIALSGDYGKPRPALVVQDNAYAELPVVTVLPLTSDVQEQHLVRITVQPSRENGLRKLSQIMIDRVSTVPRTRTGEPFGRLDAAAMSAVDAALAGFLGLATAKSPS